MFQTLRKIFNRIRLIIGGIRSGIYGLAMVALTWIVALPPSEAEIAHLNLAENATVEAEGLRQNRIAKLLVLVATDRTYDLIAQGSGNNISGEDMQFAIQMMADGTQFTQPNPPRSGAKFVQARTN